VTDLTTARTLDGRTVVVRVSGDLDLLTAPDLDAELTAATDMAVPPAPVVLDLTAVTFLGSPVLAVLAKHHEACTARGIALHIVPGTGPARRPLDLTGLSETLNLIPGQWQLPSDEYETG
jgi:anti-sigma B factor antagonist